MSETTTRIVTLQVKEGAYTRVEYDLTKKPRLYAVDQQNGPVLENKVKVFAGSSGQMAFCVKCGQQNYLLKVDGNKLMLETIPDNPDIARLEGSYLFCKKQAARTQQYMITSMRCPTLCVIIKEEEDRHWLFDIGDMQTTTSPIAVFITPEKISW